MSDDTTRPTHCERCHRESRHLIRFTQGNTPHYVCSDCLYREDKRINLKADWRREGQRRKTA